MRIHCGGETNQFDVTEIGTQNVLTLLTVMTVWETNSY